MAGRKASTPKAVTNTVKKKKCNHCGSEKRLPDGFYASDNPIDAYGRVSMCKDCCAKNIDYSDINTVKNVLNQLNKPFLFHLWESSSEEVQRPNAVNTDIFGCYMKNLSLKHRGKGLTWKDSDEVLNVLQSQYPFNEKEYSTENDVPVKDDLIEKWGDGYSSEHYRLFEKKYSRLIRNYGEKTELHTEGLLVYIRFRVQEEMASARNDVKAAKEWAALATKAAQDAKINVSQLSKSDISGGVDVLSQLFEAVETEASIIPLLPKLLEQPYDDADMIIWSNINYYRTLEDKPRVSYREIWNFYDEMLGEYYTQQGLSEVQIDENKKARNNVFRDLGEVYIEPLYESEDV
ncbi:hypothetical protein BSK59_13025 [Paenibacillus odorifer]|uniref:hypothetical protein n=1 Tax=Paenibacillus odorifer TaxID=189426 RepID=UPI00096FC6A0|nr:hypothetical protein [Paenibacillus odorifer]OME55395.1 hypothetical protein BSK59_13025 [Paenibacillus odorifer]